MDNATSSSSLPANYVSIIELKERWLENRRQQKEREQQQKEEEQRREEELRQQEEEASKPPKPIAAVPKTDTDSKPPGGRSYRPKNRPAKPSVLAIQGPELEEKKLDEPAEEKANKKNKKKKKIWGQNKKKLQAAMEKEGRADAPPQASGEEGSSQAKEIEIRAKGENVQKLRRPRGVNQKFRDLSVNDAAGKGDDSNSRRPNGVDGKFRDLPVIGEAGKVDDNNLRGQNGVDEKSGDLPVNGEAGKGGGGNLSRRGKSDRRGNGEIGAHRKGGSLDGRKQQGCGMVWVKKGEVADGNGGGGGGVQSSRQGGVVSGQTATSSNAGSLTLAGEMTKTYQPRQWRQNRRQPNLSQ